MSAYSPGPGQPASPEDIFRYLQGELQKVSQAFASGPVLAQPRSAPPRDPEDGSHPIVFADGINWDPGSGAGFYGWNGSAWAFLGG